MTSIADEAKEHRQRVDIYLKTKFKGHATAFKESLYDEGFELLKYTSDEDPRKKLILAKIGRIVSSLD